MHKLADTSTAHAERVKREFAMSTIMEEPLGNLMDPDRLKNVHVDSGFDKAIERQGTEFTSAIHGIVMEK